MAFTTRSEARSATVWALSATLWLTSSSRVRSPLSASKRSISSELVPWGAACAAVAQARIRMHNHLDMGAKGNTIWLFIKNNRFYKLLISFR